MGPGHLVVLLLPLATVACPCFVYRCLADCSNSINLTSFPPPCLPGGVSTLKLSHNAALESLHDDAFVPTPLLRKIEACNNSYLGYISSRALRSVPSLQSLTISGGQITQIKEETFSSNGNLTLLDLHANRLQVIWEATFANTPRLSELFLQDNMIEEIPRWLFWNTPNLTVINLARNCIREIHDSTFVHTPKLKTLYLQDNRVTYLPERVFWNNHKLQVVNLARNNLTSLRGTIFMHTPNLEELYLEGNQIIWLHVTIFQKVPNLRVLNLSENGLTSLSRELLRNISSLEEINLADNAISSLDPGSFSGNPRLKMVSLERNELKGVLDAERVFSETKALESVNLESNRLETLCWRGLDSRWSRLKVLRLADNRITAMSWPEYKVHLEELTVDGNPCACATAFSKKDDHEFKTCPHQCESVQHTVCSSSHYLQPTKFQILSILLTARTCTFLRT